MGLACDSSLPLPDLADCLDIGNQSGPGKTSVGLQQGWNLAGTATGKPSPRPQGHSSMPPREVGRAQDTGVLGGWRTEASRCWAAVSRMSSVPCGPSCSQGMGHICEHREGPGGFLVTMYRI